MSDEARLDDTETGLVPASEGWFVLNLRDARWFQKPGQGFSVPLTGAGEEQEELFPMLGMSVRVIQPGQPSTTYHWEHDTEGFLVLSGRAILIVEGEERELRQWDFVHCPPHTRHAFAGAGDGPCVLLGVGSRQSQAEGEWGSYIADETAARYNASPPHDTDDSDIAYGRFPESRPVKYPGGLLPW